MVALLLKFRVWWSSIILVPVENVLSDDEVIAGVGDSGSISTANKKDNFVICGYSIMHGGSITYICTKCLILSARVLDYAAVPTSRSYCGISSIQYHDSSPSIEVNICTSFFF